jgi:energy-coupling factor transport system permease protein
MYHSGTGLLYRLNPWTKVCFVMAVVCLDFFGPGSLFLPFGLFLLIILPLSLSNGLGKLIAGIIYKLVLPTALVLFVVQGLFYPGGKIVLAQWGWFSLKQEGLFFAWVVSTRLMVMITAFSLVIISTNPSALMNEFCRRGLPASIAYLVVASIQILPQMKDRADHIVAAQRARGLNTQGSLPNRLRGLFPLVSPLILSAIIDSEERAIALQSRAFNSVRKPTSYSVTFDSRAQSAFRWSCLLLVLIGIVSRIWL